MAVIASMTKAIKAAAGHNLLSSLSVTHSLKSDKFFSRSQFCLVIVGKCAPPLASEFHFLISPQLTSSFPPNGLEGSVVVCTQSRLSFEQCIT